MNSETKVICLIGHPIKQSFSPVIHNYLFGKYNLNNIYVCFDVKENLDDTVKSIKNLGILGCNITIPYKVDIIDKIDLVDEYAKLIGSINTIKNEDGILKGYNTDGIGFLKSIKDSGYNICDKRVLVIGAGGASRSICIELAKNNIGYLKIVNRTKKNAQSIYEIIKNNFDIDVEYTDKIIDDKTLEDIDVIINTTSLGMENDLSPIDKKAIPKSNTLLCDIVYKPQNTELIKWAKSNNLEIIYGIDMLINQAFEAFYIWTGIYPSNEDFKFIKEIYNKY